MSSATIAPKISEPIRRQLGTANGVLNALVAQVVADAIKEDEAKKPEPKKVEAKTPTPPKKEQLQQPKFDPRQVAALLNKQTPQRLAATGDTNDAVNLGAPSGTAAKLSQSEIDAFKARVRSLWSPPPGAKPEGPQDTGHNQVQTGRPHSSAVGTARQRQ